MHKFNFYNIFKTNSKFTNLALVNYGGEIYLSAFAIINYITTNIYMVLLGVSIGVQPLLSYNYGAKKPDKMLKYYSITFKTTFIINIVFIIVCFIFGKSIIIKSYTIKAIENFN